MEDPLFDRFKKSHDEDKRALEEADRLAAEINAKELESLRAYFSGIFERNASRNVRVNSVSVSGKGGASTRAAFLQSQLEPIFGANDFSSLVSSIDTVHNRLVSLGIYDIVSFTLDEDQVASVQSPFTSLFGNPRQTVDSSTDLTASLHLVQAKRFLARTGTDLGNGEGNGYANFTIKNVFGGAEILSFDATIGTRTKSSYIASLTLPLVQLSPRLLGDWKLETVGYKTSRSISWASNDQLIRGVSAKFRSANHEIGTEALLRTLSCTPGASRSIRAEAGDSIKASIFQSWSTDTRDNGLLPSSGAYLKLSHELATTLNAGSPFYKTIFESQVAKSFGPYISMSMGLRGGAMWKLGSKSAKSHVMDRFVLGGPNDVRGFYVSGMGPRDGSDSLGGEAYVASGLSIFSRLPRVAKETPLRAHAFVNSGCLLPMDQTNPLATIQKLATQPSVTAGLGLLYVHSVARFELNFTLPLIATSTEATRKGLQFGVGLSFL